jgi:outer membrane protein assembly factor BamB
MRKLWAVSITILILFGILICIGHGRTEAYMFRGDLKHTGIYESIVPQNNTLLWSFDTGASMESSPVAVSGKVYFGCENGKVYCLDSSTGAEIWNFTTGNEVDSTPTVVDGVVYFGSTDMNLYAIDANTGAELWTYSLSSTFGQIMSSPALAYDKIFFGASDGNLYSLNATNHELEWTFPTGDDIQSSPAVDWPFVYIGSKDGKVYSIWANNGTENWNFSSNVSMSFHRIFASPMISNGRLYIASEDHNLYCLETATGALTWNFSGPDYIYSSASVHDGKVFIHSLGPSQNGRVYALPEDDPNGDGMINNSEIIWSFETGDWDGGSSPAIADGKVLVGSRWDSTFGRLYCLNESTGEELWNLTTGGGIVASPAIAHGVVYISCYDGILYAVGGDIPATLDIQILPEFSSIKSNRVMGISFLVTYRGAPIEGAFINVDVSEGNLSQQGASTFPDGSQRIKYTAPVLEENTTITVHASVTKFGYPVGESWVQFIVEPPSSYGKVGSGSTFSLSRYWFYITLIGILIAINVIIFIVNARKRREQKNKTKIIEEVGD